MGKNYRGRRRGVYIHPVLVLALAALLVPAALFLTGVLEWPTLGGSGSTGEETAGSIGAEAPPREGHTAAPAQKPELVTGEDGAVYVLTQLGRAGILTGELALVNNRTLYAFPAEEDLVNVYEERSGDYIVARTDILLRPVAMESLNRMMADFRAQGGSRTVNVVAGHRTAELQQHLFDQSAARNGLEHAQKYVAQPGGSEHHTGLVVDFSIMNADGSSADYTGEGEYAWINENCHNYGYIVRYDAAKAHLTGIGDEPWHFRYVGIPHATHITELGLCMEEYIEYLKDYSFENRLTLECAAGSYEAWYTPGTEVYLPQSGEYLVSGNNVDGVIVTRKVS